MITTALELADHEKGDTWFDLRVASMSYEAEGVLSLELISLGGFPLPNWSPGSHIDIRWPNGIERQYSLCGRVGDPRRWRLGILRERDGRGGSAYVHDDLRPGTVIPVRGPRCHFELVDAEKYLFIAGGIGVTPILPMISTVHERGKEWRMLYGGRSRVSMAFVDELGRYGERVVVYPEDEFGRLPLADFLGSRDRDVQVYCCGPEGLLVAAEEAHAVAGPEGSYHCERFAPRVIEARGEGEDREFVVALSRSGLELVVPPGTSILQVLKDAGLRPDFSCEEGTCGTCEATIADGVADHRDSVLTDAERKSGKTMMICVSRAMGERIVLDL